MPACELQQRLIAIFESGIHYNTALLLYSERVAFFDKLVNIIKLQPYPYKSRTEEGVLKFLHALHREERDHYLRQLNYSGQNAIVADLSAAVNAKPGPSWHHSLLLKQNRELLSPRNLLSAYFRIAELTCDFRHFPPEKLGPELDKLKPIETLIRNKAFIACRVRLKNIDNKSLDIYYDDNKTTQRQALMFAHAGVSAADCLTLLNKPLRFRRLADMDKLLMALTLKSDAALSREAFFETLASECPVAIYDKFANPRIINSGLTALEEYSATVREFYEKDAVQAERERINSQPSPSNHDSALADAPARLVGFLSSYIDLYATMCACPAFFRQLYALRQQLIAEIKPTCAAEDLADHILSIMNNLSRYSASSQEASFPPPPDDRTREMYARHQPAVAALQHYQLPFVNWGYYFDERLVPGALKIISMLNNVNELSGSDSSHITHDDLAATQATFKQSFTPVGLSLFPPRRTKPLVSYREGNPFRISPYPENRTLAPATDIKAALDLFDRKTFQQNLENSTITREVKELEKLLWGMFYRFEKTFSSDACRVEQCLAKIDSCYSAPTVSEKKFRNSIKMADKLIADHAQRYQQTD